jgi:hypothetical protein
MKNSRTLFLLLFFFFASAQIIAVQAASFTADAVQIRGDNVSHAKMFWLDGNVRFEYTEDSVPMVQIFDNKNNKIIWLDVENKYFLEREMLENEKPENENILTGNKSKKNTDPCKQFAGAECIFLKKTKIKGRAAEKWLITLNNNGHGNSGYDFHIFQWIDSKYKNILRQENSDGTGLSVEVKDNQEMNNRKVRKLTMVAFSASGEQQQGVQWYDNELDIVVRQQYEDNVIDELRNISLAKVSKKLFVIPKGYTRFKSSLETAEKVEIADAADNK